MLRVAVVACAVMAMMGWIVSAEEMKRDEQKVYIPYNKLTEIFGEESRAVIVPYEDFLKLWKAIPDQPTPEPTPAPPIDAALTGAKYSARIDRDIAIVDAQLSLQSLRKGWSRVLLGFQDIYLLKAQLDTGELVITHSPQGYEILLPGPGNFVLTTQFASKVEEQGADFRLGFSLPPCPASEIQLIIPGKAVAVTTTPKMAVEQTTQETETTLRILNGAVNQFALTWQLERIRRGEAAAIAYVTSVHRARATADFQRIVSRFHYEVKGESLQTVSVELPKNARLLDVTGSEIDTWTVAGDQKSSILKIVLQESLRDFYFETELESSAGVQGAPAPIPYCLEVRRERGYILIYRAQGLQIVTTPGDGVYMAALDEVPNITEAEKSEVEQAYYYLTAPASVSLTVERKQPRIEATLIHQISIKEEVLEATYYCTIQVRNAPIFNLEIGLPKNLELIEVQPPEIIGDYRLQPKDDLDVLVVVFTEPVHEEVTFSMTCRMARSADAQSLTIPLISTVKTDREIGTVVVDALEKFKLQTLEQKGLLPINLETVRSEGAVPETFGQIAYRYGRTPIALVMGVETRSSRVTADVYMNLNVEQDIVRVTDQIKFSVLYAGIDKVRIKIPQAVSDNVEIEGPQIKEKALKEKVDNQSIWEVQFQDAFTGDRTISVSYYQKIQEDKGVAGVTPEIIEVLDVAREVGYVMITKGANIEVSAVVEELEAYDSADLPAEFLESGTILCWKYIKHPFALKLTVTRHEFEDLVNTIVHTMSITTVVSRERTAVNHLRMIVHNKGRQYIATKLPENTKVYELLVNGAEVRPSLRPSDGMTLIPLSAAVANESMITIELLYEYQLGRVMRFLGRLALRVPETHLIPVQKTYQELYLPQKFVYFPPGGSMQVFDYRYDSNVTVMTNEWNQAAQGQQSSASMETKLATLLVKEGRFYQFVKLHGPGTMSFWFLGRKTFLLFRLLLLVAPLAAAYVLLKRYGLSLLHSGLYLGLASALGALFSQGFYRSLFFWPLLAAIGLIITHYYRLGIFKFRPRPQSIYVPPPSNDDNEPPAPEVEAQPDAGAENEQDHPTNPGE